MVVIDATVLLLLVDPSSSPPLDPSTNQPLTECQARIELLVKMLSESKTRILIPSPVLSEVLVVTRRDATTDYLAIITQQHSFQIQPFDTKAAIEVAQLTDDDLASGRELSRVETYAKLKYDRQIIAIAKVNGCSTIYSDDNGLAAVAKRNGIKTIKTSDLPLPPQDQQGDFFDVQPEPGAEPGGSSTPHAELAPAAGRADNPKGIQKEEDRKEVAKPPESLPPGPDSA